MKVRRFAIAAALALVAGAAQAGPPPGGADTDGDTVEDAFDNCRDEVNSDQADTDHNGCGNPCTEPITCDLNGDTGVGAAELACLGMFFGMTAGPGSICDCDGDGLIGAPDAAVIGMEFGNTVGPSGIVDPPCDSATCQCGP